MILTWHDVGPLFALLPASTGVCVAALFLAAKLHVDPLFQSLVGPPRADQRAIEELARHADIAKREGILSIEVAVGHSRLPLFKRAIALALDGLSPHEIKASLSSEIDAGSSQFQRIWRFASIAAYGICVLLSAAGIALIASTPSIGPSLAWAALGAFPVVVGLSVLPAVRDWLKSPLSQRVLLRMLVVEAVCQMASGADGAQVRARLGNLLPKRAPETAVRSIAA